MNEHGYTMAYLRFALGNRNTSPPPSSYGVTPERAALIRADVDQALAQRSQRDVA